MFGSSTIYLAVVLAFALTADGFVLPARASSSRWVQLQQRPISGSLVQLSTTSLGSKVKPDLFSDDLFEDDEEEDEEGAEKAPKKKAAPQDSGPKGDYLGEEWKLSPEDEKAFKGFPGSEESSSKKIEKLKREGPPREFPCFAVVYKLKKQYIDADLSAVTTKHEDVAQTYDRFLNSEVMLFQGTRGVVTLWVGLTDEEGEKEKTANEIEEFMEKCPFVVKEMVERWDVIALEEPEGGFEAMSAQDQETLKLMGPGKPIPTEPQ